MKIKNTGTNVALIVAGSIVGTMALTYVIAKKANIDYFVVAISPILGIGVASLAMQNLIESTPESMSNAVGSVKQVKGRFP